MGRGVEWVEKMFLFRDDATSAKFFSASGNVYDTEKKFGDNLAKNS
jgi:hypothetical protein